MASVVLIVEEGTNERKARERKKGEKKQRTTKKKERRQSHNTKEKTHDFGKRDEGNKNRGAGEMCGCPAEKKRRRRRRGNTLS